MGHSPGTCMQVASRLPAIAVLLSSAVSSRGLMDEVFSRCLHAAASVSLVIAVCYQVLCPAGAGWMNCSPCACMQLRQCYQPLLFAIKCCVQ